MQYAIQCLKNAVEKKDRFAVTLLLTRLVKSGYTLDSLAEIINEREKTQ